MKKFKVTITSDNPKFNEFIASRPEHEFEFEETHDPGFDALIQISGDFVTERILDMFEIDWSFEEV